MVIEWLQFRVPAEHRERFVRVDDEIWTAALQTYPGFIGKETWISPNDDEVVIFVIRWQTREEWKAIPEEDLAAIEARFDEALEFVYTMEVSREFQVRRFPY
ncbi:MAG: TIGR03792 family protein [Cyanobacteria bacterium P01_F01_bin.86]